MLGPAFVAALRLLVDRLAGTDIDWAIGSSCSLALRGMDIQPNDIDVDASATGVYRIQAGCRDLLVRPVQLVTSPRIRSHWGALELEGVQVELVGAFQVLCEDGAWTPPPDVQQLREHVTLGELRVPVMPLSHVRESYRLLGKADKAALIDRWLADHPDA